MYQMYFNFCDFEHVMVKIEIEELFEMEFNIHFEMD